MIAWMFPGQGSQRPGMAVGLEACRDLFPIAHRALGVDLEPLCTTDSRPVWSTALLQPALFLVCVGAARGLSERLKPPSAVVGHSLGEFAALVAAKSLSFEEGLHLVSARAQGMQAAARRRPGRMAAVLGLDPSAIESICAELSDVWVSNVNSPSQTVISGEDEALAMAAERCREAGAKRVVRLDVPIAGHSPLMASAAADLEAALAEVELKPPACPFYSVVDARSHRDPVEICDLLVRAVTSPVRFSDAIQTMRGEGIDRFLEVGPGGVLSGLVRRILPDPEVASVASDSEADALAADGLETVRLDGPTEASLSPGGPIR